MDKVLKLVVSLLAGIMALAVFVGALMLLFVAIAFVIDHFVMAVNVALASVVIALAWKVAYDTLFGDDECP